jgi:ribonucleoside-diphosphate reductase alpha chain
MNIYTTAWDKGLKTTYYLHMKPRHNAEQSTTTVNKMQMTGKRGFAVLKDRPKVSTEASATEQKIETPKEYQEIKNEVPVMTNNTIVKSPEIKEKINIHMPEDPQEKFLCESCQ